MFVLEGISCRSRKRKKKKRRSEKSKELVDIGPIFNRLHTSLCFDVAGEIKKGWNRELKERERKKQEKEQRDKERKTHQSHQRLSFKVREREERERGQATILAAEHLKQEDIFGF